MRLAPLLAATLLAAASPPALGAPQADHGSVTVPMTIDQIFGARPVVVAGLNGRPLRLVIHANAGPYLQINHAEAREVGARDLKRQGAYGISAPGRVSDLGRDEGTLDRLAIGRWKTEHVPVAVFEVPAGGSQGMLGLPWLHDNRVVLDFARRQVRLPGADAAPAEARLAMEMRRRGYSTLHMTTDPRDGRSLVTVAVNGVSAPMVVSTVASVDLDTRFAQRAHVGVGKVTGRYGGPSGATGQVFDSARPVVLHIADWTSEPTRASIEDTYAYAKFPRPADPKAARGGALGADFMIRNGAVIDFGAGMLYLRRR